MNIQRRRLTLLTATAASTLLFAGCATTKGAGQPTVTSVQRYVDLESLKGKDMMFVALALTLPSNPSALEKRAHAVTYVEGARFKVDPLKRMGRSNDEIDKALAEVFDAELAPGVAKWRGVGFSVKKTMTWVVDADIPKMYKDGRIQFTISPELLEDAPYLRTQMVPFEAWTLEEKQTRANFHSYKVEEKVIRGDHMGLNHFVPSVPVRSIVDIKLDFPYPREKLEEIVLKSRRVKIRAEYQLLLVPTLDRKEQEIRGGAPVTRLKLVKADYTILDVQPSK